MVHGKSSMTKRSTCGGRRVAVAITAGPSGEIGGGDQIATAYAYTLPSTRMRIDTVHIEYRIKVNDVEAIGRGRYQLIWY